MATTGGTQSGHARVLVVDDDRELAEAIVHALDPSRFLCEIATSGASALMLFAQQAFDVVLTDLHMEGIDGLELLRRLKRLHPEVPVVLVTGDASIPRAVEAVKIGALDYITKPFEASELRELVSRAVGMRVPSSRPTATLPDATEELVGESPAMVDLRARIALVATASSPVLVLGETGTGKELVTRAIHACGPRRHRPFVAVNTSAIPETLLESQLFGHVRGAFTGAAQAHRGLFVEAEGGTLFLDEIGDMPYGLQAKLLRVLQSGEIRALGAERVQHVDVRIVAATHRRLPDLVREGSFREDLYYRLNVVSLVVPPLRERTGDIPALARCFLAKARARAPESPAESLSDDLLAMLKVATFPGNVRELESLVERLVVLARDRELTPSDLARAENERAEAEPAAVRDASLDGLIRRHVESVLAQAGGNKAHAARILGVDLSTLYRWQRKWRT